MDIKRVAINAVNEIIVMTVVHSDYKGQVQKRINEKMPLATVKGFRKGQVPKDIVEKHYGKQIKQEEIKKVVDLALERYIQSERLAILGTPIAKENENFSWDNEELVFEYEIGLVPDFELNLEAPNNIVKYEVIADDVIVEEQVNRLQKRFGELIEQETISVESEVFGTFENEKELIFNKTAFEIEVLTQDNIEKFIGKKAGEVITLNTKNLFKEEHDLMQYLKIPHNLVHTINVEVSFTIEKIETRTPVELNQAFFDKLFGEGKIATVEELKSKIKEEAEAHFEQQSKQKLASDVTNFLIENTPFELPEEFLKKWLQNTGEKKLTKEEAEAEYTRSEKSLRYQLIEGKALSQNNIQITFEDLKQFTTENIREQMVRYTGNVPTNEEVEKMVAQVLSKQDEVKQISNQVAVVKLHQLFTEKANPTTKVVTYKEFVAASFDE